MVAKLKGQEPEVHVSLMTITPVVAAEWLKRNTSKNRKVHAGLVLKYAEDIRAGRWQINGSTIVMASTGAIIDGQHRLLAIVEAQRPVQAMVVSGVNDAAFETIDTGRARTPADVLSIMGYTNTADLAALGRLDALWEKHGTIAENGRLAMPTTQEIVANVNERFDAYIVAISRTSALRKLFGAGSMWAWYFGRLGELDVSDRDFFFERLADGQGLVEGDPIYALRSALVNARLRSRSMPRSWVGGMIVKAWNKYRTHERIKHLSFNATEDYPQPI